MATLTVREVPDEVRDTLAREARDSGRSLQAFLLDILKRQADFSRNRQLLLTIADDLKLHGGAAADTPDAAEILADARARRDARLTGDGADR